MLVSQTLIAFSLAAFFLTITPGLDTAMILRTSSVEGGKKGFEAFLGISTGCFIWGAAVAFGLGAILAVSDVAYTLLKVCGAGYLAWLGIHLLLKPRQTFSAADPNLNAGRSSFLKGLLTNILNPKIGIFYVSFLPQFIPAGHSPIIWTFLLVSIHVAIGLVWAITLILTTRYAAAILRKSSVVKWMDRVTGGIFLLFAIKLASSHR